MHSNACFLYTCSLGYVLDGLPTVSEQHWKGDQQIELIKSWSLQPDFIINVKVVLMIVYLLNRSFNLICSQNNVNKDARWQKRSLTFLPFCTRQSWASYDHTVMAVTRISQPTSCSQLTRRDLWGSCKLWKSYLVLRLLRVCCHNGVSTKMLEWHFHRTW